MKSMQRKFGGLMKRSADEADVGQVIAEFKNVDDMLDRMLKDLTAWRNGWEDILKSEYDCSEAFANLYNPIEPNNSPDMRLQPAVTPQTYMSKCLGLQKLYSDLKTDLGTEINMIDSKLINPVKEAKTATKGLHKTLKHRENMKLDYERYLSRAEHARKKEQRSIKEEAALQQHESNLAQSQIDYSTADDQVRQTFPPVTEAVISLLPYVLANQVMLQTTLTGQLYTVLDKYTKAHRLPNPAPGDAEIISAWEREFTGFRKELEQGIGVIANGKAAKLGMELPAEKGSTYTGLGIRNKTMAVGSKAGGMMHRKGSQPGTPGVGGAQRPSIASRPSWGSGSGSTGNLAITSGQSTYGDEEEAAPPKPPRPGGGGSGSPNPGYGAPGGLAMPSPQLPPMGSKPRIPSSSNLHLAPYDGQQPPPAYDQVTPPSRYQTPLSDANANANGSSSNGGGYFGAAAEAKRRLSSNQQNSGSPSSAQQQQAFGLAHAAMGAAAKATPEQRAQAFGFAGKAMGANSTGSPQQQQQAFGLANSAMGAAAKATPEQRSQAFGLANSAISSNAAMGAAAKKKPPPPVPQKRVPSGLQAQYVTALYDFEGQNPGDLAFREGDRIRVVKKTESVDDWWEGELGGAVGSFPANYVVL